MSIDESGIDPRVRGVFARVISPDVARRLGPGDGTDTVEGWDSRSFVAIVMGIEEEFGVRFSTLEAVRMSSVRGILEILREKGALRGT